MGETRKTAVGRWLAWRYGCDPDQLRDDINPEDLGWQFGFVMPHSLRRGANGQAEDPKG